MDADVATWTLEFLLRRPCLDESLLELLITALPLPTNDFSLNKSLLLRKISFEIADGDVSEGVLDLLELMAELDRAAGLPAAADSLKLAYCHVAVDCTLRAMEDAEEHFQALREVRRVWKGRVQKVGESGLGSEEMVTWTGDFEAAEWDVSGCKRLKRKGREVDAVGAVRVYLAEAWEGMGPTFLDDVATASETDGALREVLGLGAELQGDDVINTGNKATRNSDTTTELRQHPIIIDGDKGSQDHTQMPSDKVQEAPETGSTELHAIDIDPLPEALQVAENVMSKTNSDTTKLKAVADESETNRPCSGHGNNAPTPSLTRNTNAPSCEQSDGLVDDLPGSDTASLSRNTMPFRKDRLVSVEKYKKENTAGRRKYTHFSDLEEKTLREGVKLYGYCWKTILTAYHDIFSVRTDVDLKDKWYNITHRRRR